MPPSPAPDSDRTSLRRALLAARKTWWASEAAAAAHDALAQRLWDALVQLEPTCLGVYWALPGEFNPNSLALKAQRTFGCTLALPTSQKNPPAMHYRLWDGQPPRATDDHGIACADGREVRPDVLLVPCVGHTAGAIRLGYGGGYFDRYLAAHPEAVAIGLSWEIGLLPADQLVAQAHDVPLMAVITERNTWSS